MEDGLGKPIISVVIPAKGESERLENKNLLKIRGKSIVRIACEKCLKCKNVDNVYLDTESEDIIRECSDLFKEGLKLIKRPKQLATNFVGGNELIIYEIHSIEYCDLLLHHYCTAPFISADSIDRAIEEFYEKGEKYDSFFTVERLYEYLWDENHNPINFSPIILPNSQNLAPLFRETHGLYGIRTNALFKCKTRLGVKPMPIEIPRLEGFDINDGTDLKIVQGLSNDH